MPEARLEDSGAGLSPASDGWFVMNARDAVWLTWEARGSLCSFENPEFSFPQLSADGAFYRLHYAEGIDYVLSRDGAQLWICWSTTVAESDIFSYLLGPVMGFVLRVRGVVCLHASAVAVDRKAVVFIGDAGAGKSTTAMAMGRLGYPIISDDIVPIYKNLEVIYAQPGYPRMRLRQTSLPMLSDLNLNLPPLPDAKGQGRLHFDLTSGGYQFQSAPLPIGALYLLADRSADPHAPRVEPVSPLDGIMGIVANTYATRFLDRAMRAHELQQVSHLVNQVAVRKVYPHREPSNSQRSVRLSWEISAATNQPRWRCNDLLSRIWTDISSRLRSAWAGSDSGNLGRRLYSEVR